MQALTLAALAASAGIATAQQAGISDATIKLGTQAPMSGPVAMIGMVADGIDLKFKAINAAGGVKMGDGKTRKVELVIMDDANEPPRTVTNARRMAEQMGVFAFVGSVGTPQNQAIKAYVTENKIPNLFIYSGIYEWGDEKQNPWGTMLVPSFTTESAIYAKYLQANKPNAKVAMLHINTDFGTNFLDGFKAAIKGTGVTLVAAQSKIAVSTILEQLAREHHVADRHALAQPAGDTGEDESLRIEVLNRERGADRCGDLADARERKHHLMTVHTPGVEHPTGQAKLLCTFEQGDQRVQLLAHRADDRPGPPARGPRCTPRLRPLRALRLCREAHAAGSCPPGFWATPCGTRSLWDACSR